MPKNLSIFNSKKKPRGFIVAATAVVVLYIVELCVLPINFFTFRIWEAVSVYCLNDYLPGPFYPNMKLGMVEQAGDLGHNTSFGITRHITWETDNFGYRNIKQRADNPDLVVIGDSFIVGAALAQTEMLSESLSKKLNTNVYAMAPIDVNDFLTMERFKQNKPGVVIFGWVERELTNLPLLKDNSRTDNSYFRGPIKSYLDKNQQFAIFIDRACKHSMIRYVVSNFDKVLNEIKFSLIKSGNAGNDQNMLFFQGVEANKDIPSEEIKRIANIVKSYEAAFEKRGIDFVFLPIPNKENIYSDFLSDKKKPTFISNLFLELERKGVYVVDIQTPYRRLYEQQKEILYRPDDTHWNEKGVDIAAEQIISFLRSQELIKVFRSRIDKTEMEVRKIVKEFDQENDR